MGGLGVIIWELVNGTLTRHKAIEESISCFNVRRVRGLIMRFFSIAVVTRWNGFVVPAPAASVDVGCFIHTACH